MLRVAFDRWLATDDGDLRSQITAVRGQLGRLR